MTGKLYTVRVREVWTRVVEVRAEDEAEAIRLVSDGNGEELESASLEETCDTETWSVSEVPV